MAFDFSGATIDPALLSYSGVPPSASVAPVPPVPSATSYLALRNANASNPVAPQSGPDGSGAILPDYGTFKNAYVNAAAAREKAVGNGNLWSWISGSGRDAAIAQAQAEAPMAYYKMLGAQAQAQGMQMDTGQTAAFLKRNGFKVNDETGHVTSPEGVTFNPAALQQGTTTATGAGAAAATGSPVAAPPTPEGGAPPSALPMPGNPPSVFNQPTPNSAGVPGVPNVAGVPPAQPGSMPAGNPVDAQRAFFTRMALMMGGLPKFAPLAQKYFAMGQLNLPPGTMATPDGQVRDSITGAPVGMTVGQLLAQRAAQSASADAGARLPFTEAAQNNQAAQDRRTVQYKAQFGFQPVQGPDGKMYNVSNADIAARNFPWLRTAPPPAPGAGSGVPPATQPSQPSWQSTAAPTGAFADPKTHEAQVSEVTQAQKDAAGASQMQQDVATLGGAITKFGTSGPWASTALSALQHLQQLHLLDPETSARVGAGELAQLTSNNVAAGMARQLTQGGRMLAGVFNQVVKAKPSIATSNPTQALEALYQEMQRQQDMAAFKAQYYGQSGSVSKLDATTAFNKAHPIDQYESLVLPLPTPPDRKFKLGYGYKMNDDHIGVFTGTGFKLYRGFGQYGR